MVVVCSLVVTIFSVAGETVYIVLHEDDTCPVFLHKKQVTVSSVINIRYEVLSKAITIDPGSFVKSSGFI